MVRSPVSCPAIDPPEGPDLSPSHVAGYNPSSSFFPASSSSESWLQGKSQSSSTPLGAPGDSQQEVQDLKEQLEALRCQVGCFLQHSIKNVPISHVMRAKLMSTHCCRGKISSVFQNETGIRWWTAPPSGCSVLLCTDSSCYALSKYQRYCDQKIWIWYRLTTIYLSY